jgi:adenosylcobinamide kinase/adenosylcobinamide-phosphate guanylyltransferase
MSDGRYPALIVGGARSGKSRWAERLAEEAERRLQLPVCYIATAQALDDEMGERIRQHQQRRPSHWLTVEEPLHVADQVRQWSSTHIVIVECLTLWLSNWLQAGLADDDSFRLRVDDLTAAIGAAARPVIVVSNEVGWGVVPANALARRYADWLGWCNQAVAQVAAQVYLTVAGIPVPLLGQPSPEHGSIPATGLDALLGGHRPVRPIPPGEFPGSPRSTTDSEGSPA